MKKMLFFLISLAAMATACTGGRSENNASQTAQVSQPEEVQSELRQERVEVLYFHGKKRCITCNAIEQLTKEVIETDFADEVVGGSLVFKVIDISDPNNEALAERYEVTWSSLFVNKWSSGEETRGDMTDFGFSYAKSSPDQFREGLKEKIQTLLTE